MFWRVFKRFPSIISCRDKISYPELQEMYAIIQMEDDYTDALNEKEQEELDSIRNNR